MIQIILPISRSDYLDKVFQCLNSLIKPKDTELLIVLDGKSETLEYLIVTYLERTDFKWITVITFESDGPKEEIKDRRQRIADIHNLAREYIKDTCEYVFCIEDDTTYPPETLKQFLSHRAVYVEGVQLGRHNTPYIGAWESNGVDYALSMMPPTNENIKISRIIAGGLYCCLIKANHYKEHDFKVFDEEGSNGLGCDFNLGYELTIKKHRVCLIDWTIQCGHLTPKGSIDMSNTIPKQVMFEKKDRWRARVV
jgi:glycosyltransferase involved in cell wall biosynthesis